jgi:hypothetical protein
MNQQPGFRRVIGGLPQCSGHCQQGRAVCDCDPALPIGQDDPENGRARMAVEWVARHFGVISLVVAVLAVVGALLIVHFGVAVQPEPVHVPVVGIKGMV